MKKSVLFLLIALVLLVSCNQDEVHVHKFDEGTVTTAPTCTADGVKTFKCQCGETKTEEVPALGHDKVEVEAKEATCTEKGWKAYEKCKREGCDYSTYEEIEAKGHTEGTPVTTAATCTAAGSTVVKCTVCNEVISETPIEKLGHTSNDGVVTTEPTCTKEGEKTFSCIVCNTVLSTEKVPATGHTEGTPVTTAATCTAAGSTVVKCTVCNEVISTTPIEKLAHDLEKSSTTAATCINKAVVTYKCKNCDYTENREEGAVDSTNHTGDTEWVVTTEAKFFTKGVETKKCKSCNTLLSETREVDFKDPTGLWMTTGNDVLSFASGKLTLGAIQSGYYVEFGPYTYKIEDDKFSYSSDSTHWISVDILGETADTMSLKIDGETKTFTRKTTTAHVHTYKTEKWACEDIVDKDGYIEMSLHSRVTNCEDHDELKFVDFSSHSYENGKCKICDCDERFEINIKSGTSLTIYLATNKAGFKLQGESTVTYTLDDSTTTYHGGDTYTPTGKILITDVAYAQVSDTDKAKYSAILSTHVHSFDDGTVTTAATCTTEGVKTFKCQCGETKTEKVPATGHTETSVTTAATCTAAGSTVVKCTVCNEVISTTPIEKLEHTSNAGVITTKPTCTEEGEKTFSCTVCNTVLRTEKVPATGHTETSVTTAATCTAAGSTVVKCTVCNAVISETPIEKLGHTSNDGVVTTEPTCTKEGEKTFSCIVCNTVLSTEKVPATGHTETSVTTAATCTAAGSTVVKCTVCNEVISTTPIEKLAHDFEDTGTVKSVATCQAAKVVTYKCKNCTHTEDRSEGDKDSTNHTGDTEWKVATSADEAKYFTEGTETEYCKSCNATTGNTRKYFRALTGFWEGKVTTSKGDAIVTLSFNDASQLKIGTNVNGNYREDSNPYDYAVSTDGITCLYYTFTDPSEDESNKGEVDDKISLTVPLIDILDADTNDTVEFTRKTVEAHTHTYADTWEPVEIKDNNGYITYVGHSKKMSCTAHTTFAIEGNHEYSDAGVCTLCGAESYYEVTQKVVEEGAPSLDTFCYVKKGESFKLPGESSVTYTLNDTTTTYHGGDTYTPTGKILITDDAYANVSASDKAEYSAILSTYVQ